MKITYNNVNTIGPILAAAHLGDSFYLGASSNNPMSTEKINCLGVTQDGNHLIFSVECSAIPEPESPIMAAEMYRTKTTWAKSSNDDEIAQGEYSAKIGPTHFTIKYEHKSDEDGYPYEHRSEAYLVVSKEPGDRTYLNATIEELNDLQTKLQPLRQFDIDMNQDFRLPQEIVNNPEVNDAVKSYESFQLDFWRELSFADFLLINNRTKELTNNNSFLHFNDACDCLEIQFNPYAKNKINNKSLLDLIHDQTLSQHLFNSYDAMVSNAGSCIGLIKTPTELDDIEKFAQLYLTRHIFNRVNFDAEINTVAAITNINEHTLFKNNRTLLHAMFEIAHIDHPYGMDGHISIAKRFNINVNQQDDNGNTPLHAYTQSSLHFSEDKARTMLNLGADFSIQNNAGKTVLDIAQQRLDSSIESQAPKSQISDLQAFMGIIKRALVSTKAQSAIQENHLSSNTRGSRIRI